MPANLPDRASTARDVVAVTGATWETEPIGPPTDHVHDVSCWYRGCERYDVHGDPAEPSAASRPVETD